MRTRIKQTAIETLGSTLGEHQTRVNICCELTANNRWPLRDLAENRNPLRSHMHKQKSIRKQNFVHATSPTVSSRAGSSDEQQFHFMHQK